MMKYRILDIGEIIKQGDEVYNDPGWIKASVFGLVVGWDVGVKRDGKILRYRRLEKYVRERTRNRVPNIKRYFFDDSSDCFGCECELIEQIDGEWIKFEDIKHLLPTSAQQPQGATAQTPKAPQ